MDYKKAIAKSIADYAEISVEEIEGYISVPPNDDMGDYAFPCFRLAKALRKAPAAIAEDLRGGITMPEGIVRMEVAGGGYLNFYADKTGLVEATLLRVLKEKEDYSKQDIGHGGNVCIDYSSINIAKPFHFGHLPSTVIGNSLYRIFNCIGYNSVGINHLGDWGTQFGKMIVAYRKWANPETVREESVRGLVKLYVRFHDEAEKDAALNDEARAWFRKIELGDPEALELFNLFKSITLDYAMEVYELLGVKFDSYAGESFYEDKMQVVVDELNDKGLLKVDQGASIVDLSEYSMPPCIILRSDGATLYATRDIATAIYRKNTYDFVKSLYVVAYQQDLHFRQFFKVLELMGKDWVKDMEHVNFGMVSMEEGTLSTRQGNIVYLEDVLRAAIEKTLDIIKEKSPDLEDKEAVARDVGVGAIVWGTLYNSRIKDITFTWEKTLNFDGETGPYVQYTHARACSVLRKAGGYDGQNVDASLLTDAHSVALIKAIDDLAEVIPVAAERCEPYLIARTVMEIASCFNKFYYENRIMDDDMALRNARLALSDCARIAIHNGLYLLGIAAPEQM